MYDETGSKSVVRFVATALAVWLSIFLTVRAFAAPSISTPDLEREITARITRVEEFKTIRAFAEKSGVKVYLFGGTAAGFAHYVKWDLQRERGDKTFQADNFDYDYTNIYRSTQDLDIVIDGNEAHAKELEQFLMSRFAYMKGGKSKWEVRLLRDKRGDKIALLDNPDFLNQHTDSNSTGMIEITKESNGDVVRDLRDWRSEEPFFLRDVAEGKIHYYDSPLHGTTSHFMAGENPPIISVIRYLTKAFQFELEMRPEDIAIIQKRIDEFDAAKDLANYRASGWIEKNAAKLIQNAVNIEYAIDTLDRLGLRKKLIALGDPTREQTMAWWLAREPLRTKALGREGKTARELGIKVVAHETSSFLAYESITRSKKGDPNVLISRRGFNGETAAYGNGFYTRKGREGARGTKITIRFDVDPEARLGVDFIEDGGDYVIFENKSALRVIPESLNLGVVDFLILVSGPDFETLKDERALMEKLRRRLTKWTVNDITAKDNKRIRQLMMKGGPLEAFVEHSIPEDIAWIFSIFTRTEFEPWVRTAVAKKRMTTVQRLETFRTLGWYCEKSDVEALLRESTGYAFQFELIEDILFKQFTAAEHRPLFETFIETMVDQQRWGVDYLTQIEEFAARLTQDPRTKGLDRMVLEKLLAERLKKNASISWDFRLLAIIEKTVEGPEAWVFIDRMLAIDSVCESFLRTLVEEKGLSLGRARIDAIVERMYTRRFGYGVGVDHTFKAVLELAEKVGPDYADRWLTKFADSSNYTYDISGFLRTRDIAKFPRFRAALVNRELSQDVTARVSTAVKDLVQEEDFEKTLKLVERGEVNSSWLGYFAHSFTDEKKWLQKPDLVRRVMKLVPYAGGFIVESPEWSKALPDVVTVILDNVFINSANLPTSNVEKLLRRPESARHPEWFEIVVRKGTQFTRDLDEIVKLDHWQNHPVLKEVIRLSGGINRFMPVSRGSLSNAFVNKNVTVAQAEASLEKRAQGGLLRKWLGPRMAAPTCENTFVR